MKSNRWIELSQRFYRRLLHLYPQAYRTIYEDEMARFFTSECREANQLRGRLGILLLWLRTFVDVGKTVLIEHLSDPNAKVGILEAMPNAPLPWKGVFLVLIPGLIFFISQIMQLASDKDWFFIAYYRAAFFLIIPVLLVWLLTRRFPVWGLIPLGLLYGTLQSYPPDTLLGKMPFPIHFDSVWMIFGVELDPYYVLPVFISLILLCGLVGYGIYQRQISKPVWWWLALYGILIVWKIVGEFQPMLYQQVSWRYLSWMDILKLHIMRQYLAQISLWFLYGPLTFLLLIFIGKLFIRKHHGLSFLLLLGYLLPTVVFGRYGAETDTLPFSVVVLAVLIYRFIVALVAPAWLVRTMSVRGQQRAAILPAVAAVLCHISFNLIFNWTLAERYAYQLGFSDYALGAWNQLIIAVGLALAVTLYYPRQQDNAAIAPPLAA